MGFKCLGCAIFVLMTVTFVYLFHWYMNSNADTFRVSSPVEITTITVTDEPFINPVAEELIMTSRIINKRSTSTSKLKNSSKTTTESAITDTRNYAKESVENKTEDITPLNTEDEVKDQYFESNQLMSKSNKTFDNLKQIPVIKENKKIQQRDGIVRIKVKNNELVPSKRSLKKDLKANEENKTAGANDFLISREKNEIFENVENSNFSSVNDLSTTDLPNIYKSTGNITADIQNSLENCTLDWNQIRQIAYYLNLYETLKKKLNSEKVDYNLPDNKLKLKEEELLLLDSLEKNITDVLSKGELVEYLDDGEFFPSTETSLTNSVEGTTNADPSNRPTLSIFSGEYFKPNEPISSEIMEPNHSNKTSAKEKCTVFINNEVYNSRNVGGKKHILDTASDSDPNRNISNPLNPTFLMGSILTSNPKNISSNEIINKSNTIVNAKIKMMQVTSKENIDNPFITENSTFDNTYTNNLKEKEDTTLHETISTPQTKPINLNEDSNTTSNESFKNLDDITITIEAGTEKPGKITNVNLSNTIAANNPSIKNLDDFIKDPSSDITNNLNQIESKISHNKPDSGDIVNNTLNEDYSYTTATVSTTSDYKNLSNTDMISNLKPKIGIGKDPNSSFNQKDSITRISNKYYSLNLKSKDHRASVNDSKIKDNQPGMINLNDFVNVSSNEMPNNPDQIDRTIKKKTGGNKPDSKASVKTPSNENTNFFTTTINTIPDDSTMNNTGIVSNLKLKDIKIIEPNFILNSLSNYKDDTTEKSTMHNSMNLNSEDHQKIVDGLETTFENKANKIITKGFSKNVAFNNLDDFDTVSSNVIPKDLDSTNNRKTGDNNPYTTNTLKTATNENINNLPLSMNIPSDEANVNNTGIVSTIPSSHKDILTRKLNKYNSLNLKAEDHQDTDDSETSLENKGSITSGDLNINISGVVANLKTNDRTIKVPNLILNHKDVTARKSNKYNSFEIKSEDNWDTIDEPKRTPKNKLRKTTNSFSNNPNIDNLDDFVEVMSNKNADQIEKRSDQKKIMKIPISKDIVKATSNENINFLTSTTETTFKDTNLNNTGVVSNIRSNDSTIKNSNYFLNSSLNHEDLIARKSNKYNSLNLKAEEFQDTFDDSKITLENKGKTTSDGTNVNISSSVANLKSNEIIKDPNLILDQKDVIARKSNKYNSFEIKLEDYRNTIDESKRKFENKAIKKATNSFSSNPSIDNLDKISSDKNADQIDRILNRKINMKKPDSKETMVSNNNNVQEADIEKSTIQKIQDVSSPAHILVTENPILGSNDTRKDKLKNIIMQDKIENNKENQLLENTLQKTYIIASTNTKLKDSEEFDEQENKTNNDLAQMAYLDDLNSILKDYDETEIKELEADDTLQQSENMESGNKYNSEETENIDYTETNLKDSEETEKEERDTIKSNKQKFGHINKGNNFEKSYTDQLLPKTSHDASKHGATGENLKSENSQTDMNILEHEPIKSRLNLLLNRIVYHPESIKNKFEFSKDKKEFPIKSSKYDTSIEDRIQIIPCDIKSPQYSESEEYESMLQTLHDVHLNSDIDEGMKGQSIKFKRENSKDKKKPKFFLKLASTEEPEEDQIEDEESTQEDTTNYIYPKKNIRKNNLLSLKNKLKREKLEPVQDDEEEETSEELEDRAKLVAPIVKKKIKPKSIVPPSLKVKPNLLKVPKPVRPDLKTLLNKKYKKIPQATTYDENVSETHFSEEDLNEDGLPDIVYVPFKNSNNLDVKSLLLLSNALSKADSDYFQQPSDVGYQNGVNSHYYRSKNPGRSHYLEPTNAVPITDSNFLNSNSPQYSREQYDQDREFSTLPERYWEKKENFRDRSWEAKRKRKVYLEDEDDAAPQQRKSFFNIEEPTREIANIVKSFQELRKKFKRSQQTC